MGIYDASRHSGGKRDRGCQKSKTGRLCFYKRFNGVGISRQTETLQQLDYCWKVRKYSSLISLFLRAYVQKVQYNTIRVYCENTLICNDGVHSQTGPKSGSVKARQLIYRYSTNTIKTRVKKQDMKYSIVKVITIKS